MIYYIFVLLLSVCLGVFTIQEMKVSPQIPHWVS